MHESANVDPSSDSDKTVVDPPSFDFSGGLAATQLLTPKEAGGSSSSPGSSRLGAKSTLRAWRHRSVPVCLALALAAVTTMWVHDRRSLNTMRSLRVASAQCPSEPSPAPTVESEVDPPSSRSSPGALAPSKNYADVERRLASLISANDYEAAAAEIETLMAVFPERPELTDLATALRWTVRCGVRGSTRARRCR